MIKFKLALKQANENVTMTNWRLITYCRKIIILPFPKYTYNNNNYDQKKYGRNWTQQPQLERVCTTVLCICSMRFLYFYENKIQICKVKERKYLKHVEETGITII